MGDIFDIGRSPEAKGSGAQVHKNDLTRLARLDQDVKDFHIRIMEAKQRIDVLNQDLRLLDKARIAGEKSRKGKVEELLSSIGFKFGEEGEKAQQKKAADLAQTKRIDLRMEEQALNRLYKALGARTMERARLRAKLGLEAKEE